MRSADLKAGLTRVVALGERTFAFHSAEGIAIGWRLLFPSAIVLTVLLVATWHAGQGSGQLDGQRLSGEIDLLTQKIASNQLELARQQKKINELEQALKASGKNVNLPLLAQLRAQLLQAQAEANQYKTIIQRERQKSTDNQLLIDVLSTSGAHLLAMKGSEAAADSTAYALLAENGRLLLIASRLPKLAEGRQFQLWLLRKQEPKVVSAGVFSADENSRALMDFDDRSVLSELALLEVTDEPQGGSSEPTGVKLLASELAE
jgi:hypothetical protein